jgi:hydrogenase expression/formation protein HypE
MRIDRAAIPVRPEVRAVCEHIGMDPYTSISEGTLIATVVPDRADAFVAALSNANVEAAIVGEVTPASDGTVLVTEDGVRPLEHPGLDPFWGAFGAWGAEAAGIAEAG